MSFRRRRLLRAGHNHVDRARAGPSRRHHPLLGQRISGLVLPADRRPAARSDAGPSRVGPPGRRAAGPFPLVVPDLRAHGQSTGSFDFAAAVDDVGALLEALPTDELILVGLSLSFNPSASVGCTGVVRALAGGRPPLDPSSCDARKCGNPLEPWRPELGGSWSSGGAPRSCGWGVARSRGQGWAVGPPAGRGLDAGEDGATVGARGAGWSCCLFRWVGAGA